MVCLFINTSHEFMEVFFKISSQPLKFCFMSTIGNFYTVCEQVSEAEMSQTERWA